MNLGFPTAGLSIAQLRAAIGFDDLTDKHVAFYDSSTDKAKDSPITYDGETVTIPELSSDSVVATASKLTAESGKANPGTGFIGGYAETTSSTSGFSITADTWTDLGSVFTSAGNNVLLFAHVQIKNSTADAMFSANVQSTQDESSDCYQGSAYVPAGVDASLDVPVIPIYNDSGTDYYLNVTANATTTADLYVRVFVLATN